jgi:hypothetical protein
VATAYTGFTSAEERQRDVQHKQSKGDIDEHVQRLPDGRAQVRQPEVVARCGHQEKNHEREEPNG